MEDITHLEYLSKLKFSPEERATFADEFKNIIAFVDEIAKLEIPDEFSKEDAIPISDLREDTATPSMPSEEVLQNAPKQKDGCYVTPLVVE